MRKTGNTQRHIFLVLDNVRSVYNVGSIFRTADAVGVEKIYLCGATPTPTDRFGRVRSDVHKTALGAERIVAWEYHANTLACVHTLKEHGMGIVAVEQHVQSIPYTDFLAPSAPQRTIAFVFGDEVRGVSPDILGVADHVIEIPMYGKKESLNVAVAVGIILYHAMHNR